MNSVKKVVDDTARAIEALDIHVSGIKAEFGRLFSEFPRL